jgi:hypothetical protein
LKPAHAPVQHPRADRTRIEPLAYARWHIVERHARHLSCFRNADSTMYPSASTCTENTMRPTLFTRISNPRLKRAIKATLVALVLVGGGCTWQHIASERIAERAEQARLEKLKMTPRKLEALRREGEIAAEAQAYAQRYEAERQARARRAAEDTARTNGPPPAPQRKG